MPDEAPLKISEGASRGEAPSVETKGTRRKIPGNLPYTGSHGVLQRVLEKIPTAAKPAVFTQDYLGTVLNETSGAARQVIPILKATGLLTPGATPTELYSQFQTDGGRPLAAAQALRNGFGEIFKRNQYAHQAEANALLDIIVNITGLPKTEQIPRYILNTFQVFQTYARGAVAPAEKPAEVARPAIPPENADGGGRHVGLVYNINVVLPETTNIEVYNVIFRSLRENML